MQHQLIDIVPYQTKKNDYLNFSISKNPEKNVQ